MLEQYAVEVPADVDLRLFLIEDVSADVVNMLGSVYGSYPHFFENHMYTIRLRSHGKIDMNGYPVSNKNESVASAHNGKLLNPNRNQPSAIFLVAVPSNVRIFERSCKANLWEAKNNV
jgi:hypothetical protein